jgi:hypothetical protein
MIKFNPFTGKLDLVNSASTQLTLIDSLGIPWYLSVTNDGVLTTTSGGTTPTGMQGQSIGMLLSITYAN